MLAWLRSVVERLDGGRQLKILALLAARPMSESELAHHFRLTLTLGWHLRELHAMGLIAYSRRARRYHLVWPRVDALADFCAALDDEAQPAVPAADLTTPRPGYALS